MKFIILLIFLQSCITRQEIIKTENTLNKEVVDLNNMYLTLQGSLINYIDQHDHLLYECRRFYKNKYKKEPVLGKDYYIGQVITPLYYSNPHCILDNEPEGYRLRQLQRLNEELEK